MPGAPSAGQVLGGCGPTRSASAGPAGIERELGVNRQVTPFEVPLPECCPDLGRSGDYGNRHKPCRSPGTVGDPLPAAVRDVILSGRELMVSLHCGSG